MKVKWYVLVDGKVLKEFDTQQAAIEACAAYNCSDQFGDRTAQVTNNPKFTHK